MQNGWGQHELFLSVCIKFSVNSQNCTLHTTSLVIFFLIKQTETKIGDTILSRGE